jgi:hypothetical protein
MTELRHALESVIERDLGAMLKERLGPPPDLRSEARAILLGLADALFVDERVIEPERIFLRRRAVKLGIPETEADDFVAEIIELAGCRMVRARPRTNTLSGRGADEPTRVSGSTLVAFA